jgi:hypothetical protein
MIVTNSKLYFEICLAYLLHLKNPVVECWKKIKLLCLWPGLVPRLLAMNLLSFVQKKKKNVGKLPLHIVKVHTLQSNLGPLYT